LEDFVNSILIIYIVNYKVLIELVFQRILFYICFILYFREKIAVIHTIVICYKNICYNLYDIIRWYIDTFDIAYTHHIPLKRDLLTTFDIYTILDISHAIW